MKKTLLAQVLMMKGLFLEALENWTSGFETVEARTEQPSSKVARILDIFGFVAAGSLKGSSKGP